MRVYDGNEVPSFNAGRADDGKARISTGLDVSSSSEECTLFMLFNISEPVTAETRSK